MATTLYYFLQVCICSAVLFGYYLLLLRNKKFHQYNRFYLLAILLVSWIIPLIRIPLPVTPVSTFSEAIPLKLFEVVADNNTYVEEVVTANATPINWSEIMLYAYIVVCSLLFFLLIRNLYKIYFLLRQNSGKNIGDAFLVFTQVKGTPFSFFRFIFWNNEIDLNTNVGKQILQHELVHVKEKHSVDKIINAIVLSVGWFNPIFWLVKQEIDMVHEFIADKKAVNDDPSELAQMLLTASYPVTNFSIANSFFHSPIKRRLAMMSNFRISNYPYLRRLLILPLIAVIVMLFAFRKEMISTMKASEPQQVETGVTVNKDIASKHERKTIISAVPINILKTPSLQFNRVYNVMIDAGHGGHDRGAMAEDGTKESELNLQFVKKILEENTNDKINIILARESDEYIHPQKRLELMNEKNCDLFISIHSSVEIEANKNIKSGIELIIPTKESLAHYKSSYKLANLIANSVSIVNPKVKLQTAEMGVWVIDKADRPAVLMGIGYISNPDELKQLKDENYQTNFARAVLKAIELYLKNVAC